MEDQQYVLRWHFHETALLSGLPKLLDSDLLTDITLSAGCRNIKAHRVVLATCSSYFLQLFQDMGPLQHPVVVLQDTDFNDLNAIVSFMYRGQCLVSEKQLPSVLAAAKLLQIRGLCDLKVPDVKSQLINIKSDCTNINTTNNEVVMNQPYVLSNDLYKTMMPSSSAVVCDKGNNLINIEQIPQRNMPNVFEIKSNPIDSDMKLFDSEAVNISEIPPKITDPVKIRGNYSSKCFICGKYLSNQYNLRVHMETHEEGYHACTSCPHVSRSRDALRKHISYRHPDESTSRKKKPKSELI